MITKTKHHLYPGLIIRHKGGTNSFLKKYFTGNSLEVTIAREKLLLLELLMYDIRSDWSVNAKRDKRVTYAIIITKELLDHTDYATKMFRVLQRLAVYSTGGFDGRWLRTDFEQSGGYDGMRKYHKMDAHLDKRSAWFRQKTSQLLLNKWLLKKES